MAKKFLFSILFIIVANFCYKAIDYCFYKNTEGIVVGYYNSTEIVSTRKRTTIETIKPIIDYTIDGVKYTESLQRWGGLCLPELNEKVTLLYKGDKHDPELFRFFQYWFTVNTFITVLIGSIFLTIVLEIVISNIKKS